MAVVEGSRRTVAGSVPEQFVALLREFRVEGMVFEHAWEEAFAAVAWPESDREMKEWEKAMRSTKESWGACFEGWEPLPSEIAVGWFF